MISDGITLTFMKKKKKKKMKNKNLYGPLFFFFLLVYPLRDEPRLPSIIARQFVYKYFWHSEKLYSLKYIKNKLFRFFFQRRLPNDIFSYQDRFNSAALLTRVHQKFMQKNVDKMIHHDSSI